MANGPGPERKWETEEARGRWGGAGRVVRVSGKQESYQTGNGEQVNLVTESDSHEMGHGRVEMMTTGGHGLAKLSGWQKATKTTWPRSYECLLADGARAYVVKLSTVMPRPCIRGNARLGTERLLVHMVYS